MSTITASDLFEHTRIISLDGHAHSDRLVFTTSAPSRADDSYQSALWSTTLDAGPAQARRLTREGSAAYPRLSPDGSRVAFLGQRGDDTRPVPYVMPLDGGEPQRVAGLDDLRIEGLQEWSADGRRLLAVVSVPHAEDERDDIDHPARPHVVYFLPYKLDGNGYTVGARTHLFDIDPDGRRPPKALTEGDREAMTGAWSPDGRRLAYVLRGEGSQRHRSSLWLQDEGGVPQLLTDAFPVVGELAWSPDSRRLAFSAGEIEGYSANRAFLWDGNAVQGPLVPDALEGCVVWAPDGQLLATIVSRRGLFQVAVCAPDGSMLGVHELGDSQVSLLACCGRGLVTVRASYTELDEVQALEWEPGASARPLTAMNAALTQRLGVDAERRTFRVPDGKGGEEDVEGWLLRKRGVARATRPLLVDMHGGPHSVALMDFASHVYLYAAVHAGWTVIAPNTVGSSSYGDAFALRLQGRWGTLDFPQVQAIVAQLKRDGVANEQVACAGKSYGGFLSAWAIGNGPEFKAAVVSAPVADVASHAGTSDSGYYVTPFAMGCTIDECRDRYDALSPAEYISQAHGPVLFLNGDQDLRCPVGQTEQLFTRLVKLGCAPASMVVYPGGGHALAATGRPTHREDYHARIVEFLVGQD